MSNHSDWQEPERADDYRGCLVTLISAAAFWFAIAFAALCFCGILTLALCHE
jgi:hypothetical protein